MEEKIVKSAFIKETISKEMLKAFLSLLFIASSTFCLVFFYKTNVIPEIQNPQTIEDKVESQEYALQDLAKELIVVKGDNLNDIFIKNHITQKEIFFIVEALKKINFKPNLKIGQKILLDFDIDETNNDLKRIIKKITIFTTETGRIEITKVNNNFIAEEILLALTKILVSKTVTIKSNLVQSLCDAGIKKNLAQDLVKNYSYDIDFQRQIKPEDKITLILENYSRVDDNKLINQNILYSSLQLNGKEYKIYRYGSTDKAKTYYNEDGKGLKRSLLKTPLANIKISSAFGKVRTNLQGFSYKHKGVDFSAPVGTPILSSGDGIITHIGWKSGYGKCIKINHNNSIATFYAHLDSFPKNMKLGTKVHQGQVIGRIGMTGRTTGPHLHHEVLVNGTQVDPMKMHYSVIDGLNKNQMSDFNKFKLYINSLSKEFESGKTEINL